MPVAVELRDALVLEYVDGAGGVVHAVLDREAAEQAEGVRRRTPKLPLGRRGADVGGPNGAAASNAAASATTTTQKSHRQPRGVAIRHPVYAEAIRVVNSEVWDGGPSLQPPGIRAAAATIAGSPTSE